MTQPYKPRIDERRERRVEDDNVSVAGRPGVASNPRTVTTSREPNTTDAFTPNVSSTKATGVGSSRPTPTEDEIRGRAYEIYQSRGGEPGRESEDWAQAERELREKRKTLR